MKEDNLNENMQVYIDESGDLGFSSKATNYFVIGYILVDNEWSFNTRFKRFHRKLGEKKEYKHYEIKFSKADHNCRIKILNEITTYDIKFGCIILEKQKVHQHLRDDLNKLYRLIVINPVMENVLNYLDENEKLEIFVDKCFSKRKVQNQFNSFLEMSGYYYSKKAEKQIKLHRDRINTNHIDSTLKEGLQIADCVAGTEFARFEKENFAYHNILNDCIEYDLYTYLW